MIYHLAFCFVSFYGYSAHPVLHSFPTRRSSDLLDAGRLVLAQVHDAVGRGQGRTHLHVQRGGVRPRPRPTASCTDRKSTRLNSSHRCISYAVFCLKKKKTRLEETK